ncbi:hypothetical protein [Sphingomonas yabuuchiae]|uniref:Uncharacterized protein n=1 Tax=Sphingomonas yabuuchiae TaxID=172044 RepID=A0AA41A118_9SPHN|nr:hypothetical protein [Sphingomonas yabuuchiae]MBB4609741.1 hypothetical protein [Sphingomonas yabuuchiae]MBN3558053.1 hypothetical protein [Sphingomonas yabuuchiae]
MLTELREHHAALARWLDAHRNLCAAAPIDYQALRHVRWQIALVSRKRLAFLTDTVFPLAEAHAALKAAAGLLTLRNETPAYGRALSGFIARWPMEAVMEAPAAYAHAADACRRDADKRLFAEERHLRLLLTEVEWQPGGVFPPSAEQMAAAATAF